MRHFAPVLLLLAILAAAAPTASAQSGCGGGHFESSETGPNNRVIWSDYWKAGATTGQGFSGTVELLFRSACTGTYFFEFPETIGTTENRAAGMYESFTIRDDAGVNLGDLAKDPKGKEFHIRDGEQRNFTIRFKIRELSSAEWQTYHQEAVTNAGDFGRQAYPNEVMARMALTLKPDASECQSQACIQAIPTIAFGMQYNLPIEPVTCAFTSHGPLSLDTAQIGKAVRAFTYTCSHPIKMDLTINGALSTGVVEFILEDLATPLQAIGAFGTTDAVWSPTTTKIEVLLPAGTHTVYYLVHGVTQGSGTVALSHAEYKVSNKLTIGDAGIKFPATLGIVIFAVAALAVTAWLLRKRIIAAVKGRPTKAPPTQKRKAMPTPPAAPAPATAPPAPADDTVRL